ncbi:hypothetical protein QVD17_17017 [Tagetes erecta]|uniref:Uncharacterized protein n=1 Tax=Tagetes erecta TaxID=13708 RepID=A0AAD8KSE2_TARER|nr:hypothetical protein QVD17_17017 [Tagetes erecta]
MTGDSKRWLRVETSEEWVGEGVWVRSLWALNKRVSKYSISKPSIFFFFFFNLSTRSCTIHHNLHELLRSLS